MPMRDFQSCHGLLTCLEINVGNASWVKAALGLNGMILGPMEEGMGILNQGIKPCSFCIWKLSSLLPNRPSLIGY